MVIHDAEAIVGPNNTVSDHAYAPAEWGACGILFCNAEGSAQGNIVTNNQYGMAASILDGFGGIAKSVFFTVNTVNATGLSVPIISGLHAETYVTGAVLNVTMDGNQLTGGPGDGVSIGDVEGSGPAGDIVATITNNTISDWQHGIHLLSSVAPGSIITRNNITNNVLADSGIHIDAGVNANFVRVNLNNIAGNQTGIYNGGTPTLDATCNWWDDVSGPKQINTNPGGLGDEVSDGVNYVPWLTREFQTVLADNIAYFGFPMVRLNTGWNTLSAPIALDPVCDTWGEYKVLGDGLNIHPTSPAYSFDGATQIWVPLTDTYEFKPCDAIYVRMAGPDIAAILYSPNTSVPTKEVYLGWNLVGLACLEEMPVDGALASLYTVPGDLTGYIQVVSPPLYQAPWVFVRDGHAPAMWPTKGYWVFMENGPDTLAGFTFTPVAFD